MKSRFDRLWVGTSAIAMAVASAIAVAQENAQKQEAEKTESAPGAVEGSSGEVTTIVVTGIRAALETAAETKRRSDTFVDSVTATDVASLPDMSVAEALQRVPGVQDPGASAISLQVEGLPALLSRMKAAGVVVETPNGDAVALDGGRRGALVRSPDGLLVELIEEP